MARRGPRRGAAIGVPRRARFGARPPRPARSPVSAGWVAGDRDPGDRGGDGLLRRVRDLGRYRADRGARPTGDPVSATDREDVPSGISTTESGGSGPPPRRLFHRAGRDRGSRRGQVARGRCWTARRCAGRVGPQRPPRTWWSVFAHRARLVLGQLAVAEKSNEIPCVRKILHPFRQCGCWSRWTRCTPRCCPSLRMTTTARRFVIEDRDDYDRSRVWCAPSMCTSSVLSNRWCTTNRRTVMKAT